MQPGLFDVPTYSLLSSARKEAIQKLKKVTHAGFLLGAGIKINELFLGSIQVDVTSYREKNKIMFPKLLKLLSKFIVFKKKKVLGISFP